MKRVLICAVLLTASLVIGGCAESEIYYEGELRPVSQVEEIIADQLEVENPEMDLEVSIYKDSDD